VEVADKGLFESSLTTNHSSLGPPMILTNLLQPSHGWLLTFLLPTKYRLVDRVADKISKCLSR